MKKIIIFLLLILSICIFGQERMDYNSLGYLENKNWENLIFTEKISNSEKFFSYNDDIGEEDEEYDTDESDSEEEDPYYWETYVEDDTVENDMDLYEAPIEDDTEKNMADFRK